MTVATGTPGPDLDFLRIHLDFLTGGFGQLSFAEGRQNVRLQLVVDVFPRSLMELSPFQIGLGKGSQGGNLPGDVPYGQGIEVPVNHPAILAGDVPDLPQGQAVEIGDLDDSLLLVEAIPEMKNSCVRSWRRRVSGSVLPYPGSIGLVESANFEVDDPVVLLSFGSRKAVSGSWDIYLGSSFLHNRHRSFFGFIFQKILDCLQRYPFETAGSALGRYSSFQIENICNQNALLVLLEGN